MSKLQTFTFTTKTVRVHLDERGQPWFFAADVCAAVGLTNPSETIKALDDDERMTLRNSEGHSKRGGARSFALVSESGVYALIFRSNKPQARTFRKWVTSEVLPAIRRTGAYTVPGRALPGRHAGINPGQIAQLMASIRALTACWLWRDTWSDNWTINHLRAHFGVQALHQIPAERFEEAMAMVLAKRQPVRELELRWQRERDDAERELLGGGKPWAPAERRRQRVGQPPALH